MSAFYIWPSQRIFLRGHEANLTAEAFAALAGGVTACNASSVTAILNFDDISYNRVPRVVAASNISAQGDGHNTLIVVNRIGGSLVAGATTLGSIFGILYDDAENPLSFNFAAGGQLPVVIIEQLPAHRAAL